MDLVQGSAMCTALLVLGVRITLWSPALPNATLLYLCIGRTSFLKLDAGVLTFFCS